MRRTGPDAKTCEALADRAGHCCEVCGVPIRGYNFSRQHRRARGMGGSRRPDTNALTNLLLVCGSATSPDGCHYRIESRPQWALERGYRVPQSADPAAVPVTIGHYQRVLFLTVEGAYAEANA